MPKYFDIHSHLNHPDYKDDLGEVIQRLKDTETHTIVIGTDLESSKAAVQLAQEHPEIYACIGVLAVDDSNAQFDEASFAELAKQPRVVAIGECGLDFFHMKKEDDYYRQKELFIKQIELAKAFNKPLMIHARNSYKETLEILKLYPGIRGNVHFFAGTLEEAQQFFDIGFTISFTGVITFASQYDEVIKNAPLDKILSETDAPYVAPVPYRGKRNEPSYVQEVVKKIAEVRGADLELVRETLVQNALNMIM